jgi:hypothetical protein
MGLDIIVYTKITPAGTDNNDIYICSNNAFPGRSKPFEDGFYTYEAEHHFSLGSYISYGMFREWLAEIAGYPPSDAPTKYPRCYTVWSLKEGPFWELINFADNEGWIGTDACRKLAADFDKYADKLVGTSVTETATFETWNRVVGRRVHKACVLASDNGAIQFC